MTTATPTTPGPHGAAARRRPAFDPWAPLWRTLTSVRFAVFYIGVLAALGLVGVLVPQIPEPMRGNEAAIDAWLQTREETFGPFTAVMDRLGLFSVYQARWFLAALGFLVVFVTTCTVNRWSPTFRNVFHPPRRVPDSFYERAHNRATLAPVGEPALRVALASMRFGRVATEERDGALHVFADRFAWAQLATFVSHLALILFLAGGLVTWATGFSADVFAGEGTTSPVFAVSDPNQIQVRIDEAVGTFGEKGNALDFRTHLTLFRDGREVKSGVTTVNDPLHYGGYRFHQAAFFPYGAALRISDAASGRTVFRETFPLQETTAAPLVRIIDASGREVVRDTIAPTDFLTTASGSIVDMPGGTSFWVGLTTRDDAWELLVFDPAASGTAADGGPAGQGEARIPEGATADVGGYTFAFDDVRTLPAAVGIALPDGSERTLAQLTRAADGGDALILVADGRPAIALGAGEAVEHNGFVYEFEGQRPFAGISVKRDSGAWFIWVATAMLLAGLAITFYVPRRRLWIRLTPQATQVAALAEKSGGFEDDMRRLVGRLGIETPATLREDAE